MEYFNKLPRMSSFVISIVLACFIYVTIGVSQAQAIVADVEPDTGKGGCGYVVIYPDPDNENLKSISNQDKFADINKLSAGISLKGSDGKKYGKLTAKLDEPNHPRIQLFYSELPVGKYTVELSEELKNMFVLKTPYTLNVTSAEYTTNMLADSAPVYYQPKPQVKKGNVYVRLYVDRDSTYGKTISAKQIESDLNKLIDYLILKNDSGELVKTEPSVEIKESYALLSYKGLPFDTYVASLDPKIKALEYFEVIKNKDQNKDNIKGEGEGEIGANIALYYDKASNQSSKGMLYLNVYPQHNSEYKKKVNDTQLKSDFLELLPYIQVKDQNGKQIQIRDKNIKFDLKYHNMSIVLDSVPFGTYTVTIANNDKGFVQKPGEPSQNIAVVNDSKKNGEEAAHAVLYFVKYKQATSKSTVNENISSMNDDKTRTESRDYKGFYSTSSIDNQLSDNSLNNEILYAYNENSSKLPKTSDEARPVSLLLLSSILLLGAATYLRKCEA